MTADRGAQGEQWRHAPETNGGQGYGNAFPAEASPEDRTDGGKGHHGTARGAGRGRRAAVLAALVLGLVGLAVAVTGVVIQVLPRQFTAGEQRQIEAWEVSRRWQELPAGQIFPAAVSYQLPAGVLDDSAALDLSALRISIAPQQSDCAKAVTSAAVGAMLNRNGCEAVLRATYVDATRSYVMTVGVAVLPTDAAAASADDGLSPPRLAAAHDAGSGSRLAAGVQVVGLGAGARRYDYNRQIAASFTAGPYVIMYAAGYADGRPRVPVFRDSYADAEMTTLAKGVARSVAGTLTAKPAAPHCPGSPGC